MTQRRWTAGGTDISRTPLIGIPGGEYAAMLEASKDEDALSFKRREGGEFERRIAAENDIPQMMAKAIRQTVEWPSASQSLKGILTAGPLGAGSILARKGKRGRRSHRVRREIYPVKAIDCIYLSQ